MTEILHCLLDSTIAIAGQPGGVRIAWLQHGAVETSSWWLQALLLLRALHYETRWAAAARRNDSNVWRKNRFLVEKMLFVGLLVGAAGCGRKGEAEQELMSV